MRKENPGRETVAYLICGLVSTIVSWVCMILVHFAVYDMNPHPGAVANAVLGLVNWVSGMSCAYVLNRKIVFRSSGAVIPEFLKHAVSRVGTLGLDQLIRFGMGRAGFGVYVMSFVSLIVVTIANYIIGKFFVFRSDTEKKG